MPSFANGRLRRGCPCRGHDLLVERALELRDALSAYDGVYVALAEILGATLVTGDCRLSRAPGVRCEVVVIG